MRRSVLSGGDIENFIERGWTILRNGFSRSIASDVRQRIWKEMNLSPEAPETWTQELVHICKNFAGRPFSDAFTPAVCGAIDDLLGANRWYDARHLGWWPILFPGFHSGPWTAPASGWHIDGSHFHHRLNSPTQGLLPIFIFSDIGPGDGGTALAEGTHTITANVLAESEPDGLSMDELSRRVQLHPRAFWSVLEVNGAAGDVVLIHPFLLHATSMNCGPYVRFVCNPCISMLQPFNLDHPGTLSPVEVSIRNALTKNSAAPC